MKIWILDERCNKNTQRTQEEGATEKREICCKERREVNKRKRNSGDNEILRFKENYSPYLMECKELVGAHRKA